MTFSDITVILLFVNLLSMGNTRVIETTTHSTKLTTTPVQLSTETTAPTTEGTTTVTPVSPAKKFTTLTAKGTNNRVNSPNVKIITAEPPNAIATVPENKILDLAFIMDTTSSMSLYIHSARENIRTLVNEIALNSSTDLRVALIEYRDHPPQDWTFATRTHDFTNSVQTMKTWLEQSSALGGGDIPEAVAEGLYDVTNLSWRPEAVKISVLITDAPPHGLFPWKELSFKNGSPNGHDPVEIVRNLTKREITLYTVGVEPKIKPYRDLFMAMAYLTGGQYIPLSAPKRLIDAIIGGAQEELSLQKFSKDVEEEIKTITTAGGTVNETIIAEYLYNKLQKQGAMSKQLLRNSKPLKSVSDLAKSLASSVSMAEVRATYNEVAPHLGRPFVRKPGVKYPPYPGGINLSPPSTASAEESYSYAESGISVDQIERLVRKKTAKLSGV